MNFALKSSQTLLIFVPPPLSVYAVIISFIWISNELWQAVAVFNARNRQPFKFEPLRIDLNVTVVLNDTYVSWNKIYRATATNISRIILNSVHVCLGCVCVCLCIFTRISIFKLVFRTSSEHMYAIQSISTYRAPTKDLCLLLQQQ